MWYNSCRIQSILRGYYEYSCQIPDCIFRLDGAAHRAARRCADRYRARTAVASDADHRYHRQLRSDTDYSVLHQEGSDVDARVQGRTVPENIELAAREGSQEPRKDR